jgi:ferredoxin
MGWNILGDDMSQINMKIKEKKLKMKKTKIKIDYTKCGDKGGIDPRECRNCLKVCDPCVFLMHNVLGAKEKDPYDPQVWRITAVWPSVCTRCLKCVVACPEKAIVVNW